MLAKGVGQNKFGFCFAYYKYLVLIPRWSLSRLFLLTPKDFKEAFEYEAKTFTGLEIKKPCKV